jgi:hypothetical protein
MWWTCMRASSSLNNKCQRMKFFEVTVAHKLHALCERENNIYLFFFFAFVFVVVAKFCSVLVIEFYWAKT